MFTTFFPSLRMLVVLSVLTGIVYPLLTWGIAQLAFPGAANGSLIERNGKAVGSTLIGQPFDDPKYFWSRPSATSPQPYNGASSSGSNQGPTNPALADAVKDRCAMRIPAMSRPYPPTSSRRREAVSTRKSAWHPPSTSSRASPRRVA